MAFKKAGVMFVLFSLILFWIPAASAHTSLISEEPIGNAIIEKLPSKVVLNFDESLIVIGKSNIVQVFDPSGNEITSGESQVNRNILSRLLVNSNAPGKYSVSYRVVSEDGHVVSAVYNFTLKSSSVVSSVATAAIPKKNSSPSSISKKPPENISQLISKSHSDHSFWGKHAGHFYLFIIAALGILIWRKFSK